MNSTSHTSGPDQRLLSLRAIALSFLPSALIPSVLGQTTSRQWDPVTVPQGRKSTED